MKAAVYYHPDFADHGYTTLRHRVKPGFIAVQPLIKAGLIELRVPQIDEEIECLLAQTHDPLLIERVKASGYHEVALLSSAGVVQAAASLAAGEADFVFCFVGSGGHHAGYNYCWGFCYYNDVAMAVNKLKSMGVNQILVIDIDPHSGDGTRDLLAADPEVIHLNFFADEDYAYEDARRNNFGILIDGANDQVFLESVDRYMHRDWSYQILIAIVGHDGHGQDYGDFYLSTGAFKEFAQKIRTYAAGRPVMFVLSGGSNPFVAEEVIPALITGYLGFGL
ncbi:hypothetical protein [Syntrophomonas palmitatica]|uniref:hypothetical protein n=1 Tax=Syntrophomonas palmitatica TaxID=402877 RepID=UPI0006D06A19|nr:hypothetical protein [Syntrophomonas palmitatica]